MKKINKFLTLALIISIFSNQLTFSMQREKIYDFQVQNSFDDLTSRKTTVLSKIKKVCGEKLTTLIVTAAILLPSILTAIASNKYLKTKNYDPLFRYPLSVLVSYFPLSLMLTIASLFLQDDYEIFS